VTLREGCPTLNLLAPLLLCADTRRGMQVILGDDRYSAAQPLAPSTAPPPAPEARSGSQTDSGFQTESKPQT